MRGNYRDIVTIEQRTVTDNVSTGFLEQWESLGDFYASVTEGRSSRASYQQQFSRLSYYTVRLQDGPNISYGNTRFRYTDSRGVALLLQPDEDPKYFGNSYRRDCTVFCVNIEPLLVAETVDTTESESFPPDPADLNSQVFTGDGTTLEFYPSFAIATGTAQVQVDQSYRQLNVDFYEFSDHITFVEPPLEGAVITLYAQTG